MTNEMKISASIISNASLGQENAKMSGNIMDTTLINICQ
jgi:hypothetical protein